MTLESQRRSMVIGEYNKDLHILYGSDKNAVRVGAERFACACDEFEKLYGQDREASFYSAPGRTEVGGNHTDHQWGCVLAGSVNMDVIAVVSLNDDDTVRVKSAGYKMDVITLDSLEPLDKETGKAASLIRGVCARMKSLGYKVGGFDAYTTSNVLKGSGLSSSAAFEVLIGVIISNLFNDGKINAVEIAQIAQYAENVFFGKPCGLMDQMASSVGGFTFIDFADPQNPVIQKVDFDLAAQNHSLCIVNTGGNHADLTEDYADITKEMKSVAAFFSKEVLRQVDQREFYDRIAEIRESCGDRAVLRAIHFFDDNNNAQSERDALKSGDFGTFLSLINKSGYSSYMMLQNVFSTSCHQEQGVSLALSLTSRYLNGQGACRVHGGGFAGTIQAFVPNDMLDGYQSMIEKVFGEGSCYVLSIRPVGGYALACV